MPVALIEVASTRNIFVIIPEGPVVRATGVIRARGSHAGFQLVAGSGLANIALIIEIRTEYRETVCSESNDRRFDRRVRPEQCIGCAMIMVSAVTLRVSVMGVHAESACGKDGVVPPWLIDVVATNPPIANPKASGSQQIDFDTIEHDGVVDGQG